MNNLLHSRKNLISNGLALFAFLTLLVIFFNPALLYGKVIAPLDILDHLMRPWSDGSGGFGVHNAMVYDAISQYLPYDWTICQSLKSDGFIGWNPYVYGGFSMLENTMQCPGDWHHQLYRFFDFWTAWNMGIILQFAIAGLGMVLMLRAEKSSLPSSLLGAVCYAFYSQHTTWIYHRWVLGASCWFPWMVWAVRRARRKDRFFDLFSIAFTSLSLRGGSLQTCLYVALVCLALFSGDLWEHRRIFTRRDCSRFLVFWILLTLGASLLAFDVLVNTIPPCLHGMRTISNPSFLQCLKRIPHFGTLLVPSLFGSPQTMDLGKLFGADIFETKFLGVSAIVLAVISFARKEAPIIPKICIGLVLFVTLTPLLKWFYFRATVVSALGCAWLAAWALDHLPDLISDRIWRCCFRLGTGMIVAWTTAGIALLMIRPRLVPALHKIVEQSMRQDRISRHDWLISRADSFISSFPPWATLNASMILLAAAGLFVEWRISRKETPRISRSILAMILVTCTFGELFAWSRTWITFSDKPNTDHAGTLYPVPDWAEQLQKEISGGGYLWINDQGGDFDYMQLNVLSGIGIPCLQGYETVQPHTLAMPNEKDYTPESFARSGVSHVLVKPGTSVPEGLANWKEIVNNDQIHLFSNPAFDGNYHAELDDGSRVALLNAEYSPNFRTFALPVGTRRIVLTEPFHRFWSNEISSGETVTSIRAEDGSVILELSNPLKSPATLFRRFQKQISNR